MSTESPDEIRAEIAETRRELSRDVDALEDKVSPSSVAHRQADRLRSGLGSVRERVMGSPDHPRHVRSGAAVDTGDGGSGVVGSATESVKHAASSVGDTVSSAPPASWRSASVCSSRAWSRRAGSSSRPPSG
jgi:hypothetical protein